jgi:hypothetical protein
MHSENRPERCTAFERDVHVEDLDRGSLGLAVQYFLPVVNGFNRPASLI